MAAPTNRCPPAHLGDENTAAINDSSMASSLVPGHRAVVPVLPSLTSIVMGKPDDASVAEWLDSAFGVDDSFIDSSTSLWGPLANTASHASSFMHTQPMSAPAVSAPAPARHLSHAHEAGTDNRVTDGYGDSPLSEMAHDVTGHCLEVRSERSASCCMVLWPFLRDSRRDGECDGRFA